MSSTRYLLLDFDDLLAGERFKELYKEKIDKKKKQAEAMEANQRPKHLNKDEENSNPTVHLTIDDYIEIIRLLAEDQTTYVHKLLTDLRKDRGENNKIKYMIGVGSDRQFGDTDSLNASAKGSGSCYPFFKALVEYMNQGRFNVKLNQILFEDVLRGDRELTAYNDYNNKFLKSDTSIIGKQYLDEDSLNRSRSYANDVIGKDASESSLKIQTILLHSHLAANSKLKSLTFVDDTKSHIENVCAFFSKNCDLLPPNFDLIIRHEIPNDHGLLRKIERLKARVTKATQDAGVNSKNGINNELDSAKSTLKSYQNDIILIPETKFTNTNTNTNTNAAILDPATWLNDAKSLYKDQVGKINNYPITKQLYESIMVDALNFSRTSYGKDIFGVKWAIKDALYDIEVKFAEVMSLYGKNCWSYSEDQLSKIEKQKSVFLNDLKNTESEFDELIKNNDHSSIKNFSGLLHQTINEVDEYLKPDMNVLKRFDAIVSLRREIVNLIPDIIQLEFDLVSKDTNQYFNLIPPLKLESSEIVSVNNNMDYANKTDLQKKIIKANQTLSDAVNFALDPKNKGKESEFIDYLAKSKKSIFESFDEELQSDLLKFDKSILNLLAELKHIKDQVLYDKIARILTFTINTYNNKGNNDLEKRLYKVRSLIDKLRVCYCNLYHHPHYEDVSLEMKNLDEVVKSYNNEISELLKIDKIKTSDQAELITSLFTAHSTALVYRSSHLVKFEKPSIVLHSWDFDGMLCSGVYLDKMKELIINAANANKTITMDDYEKLADHVFKTYKSGFFDKQFLGRKEVKHIIAVGTNRQYRLGDMSDGFVKPAKSDNSATCSLSSFPFYQAIHSVIKKHYKDLNIEIDKTLLEDHNIGKPGGTIFDDEVKAYTNLPESVIKEIANLLQGNKSNFNFTQFKSEIEKLRGQKNSLVTNYFDDPDKFFIAYVQMHRVASQYKDKTVFYHFTDDKGKLLNDMANRFSKNPDLIPPNVLMFIQQFLPPESQVHQVKRILGNDGGKGELDQKNKKYLAELENLFLGFKNKCLQPLSISTISPDPMWTYLSLFNTMHTLLPAPLPMPLAVENNKTTELVRKYISFDDFIDRLKKALIVDNSVLKKNDRWAKMIKDITVDTSKIDDPKEKAIGDLSNTIFTLKSKLTKTPQAVTFNQAIDELQKSIETVITVSNAKSVNWSEFFGGSSDVVRSDLAKNLIKFLVESGYFQFMLHHGQSRIK